MPTPTPAEFDPERDLPPPGARVEMGGHCVDWDSGQGYWVVTGGPHYGRLARPFSPEGLAMTRLWWRAQTGQSD